MNIKKYLIFISIIISVCSGLVSASLGTNIKTDSIITDLNISNEKEKIKVLNELANAYLSTSPEKAYQYANEAYELARKSNNKQAIGNSLNNIGSVYYNWGNYEKAIEIKNKKYQAHHPLGAKITETRLKLINSLYGSKTSIKYIDLKDDKQNAKGTKVEIHIPIIK